MNPDVKMTRDLMETLRDGEQGFDSAAGILADGAHSDLASEFRRFSQQRGTFYKELESMAAEYGDDLDESGTTGGKLHRAWMSMKDSVTGDDPEAVLKAAERGEDHAVSEYEAALEEDISSELRSLVQRQLGEIRVVHDRVKTLRDSY